MITKFSPTLTKLNLTQVFCFSLGRTWLTWRSSDDSHKAQAASSRVPWLAFSCIPCVPPAQSITAVNAGPQDTQQKGKTQWVARAGDLLAFPVKAEQDLCCGLPLDKSIRHGYAMQCMHAVYLCNAINKWHYIQRNETTCSWNRRLGLVLQVSGGSHCFSHSIFMVSHTHVIQEIAVMFISI